MLVALFALGVGAYGVFRTLAPGVTGEFIPRHLERHEGIAQLISQVWLGLPALDVFVRGREVGRRRGVTDGGPSAAAARGEICAEHAEMTRVMARGDYTSPADGRLSPAFVASRGIWTHRGTRAGRVVAAARFSPLRPGSW